MRLIDADELQADIDSTIANSGCVNHAREILDAIEYAPTIGATPGVRGKWVPMIDESLKVIVVCSICHEEPYRKNNIELPNYCPNCGAKMKGE